MSNGEKLTQDELDDFARSLGFEKDTDGQHNYTNGRIQLRDLHNENVIRTKAGNIRVIDNVMRFSDSAVRTADDILFDIERATDDISGSTMPMPQQLAGEIKPGENITDYAVRLNTIMNGYSQERMQQLRDTVSRNTEKGGRWLARQFITAKKTVSGNRNRFFRHILTRGPIFCLLVWKPTQSSR